MIDSFNNIGMDKIISSIYDFGGMSEQETWSKFAQKINIIIEHFNYLDKKFENSDKLYQEKLNYLINEGLDEKISNELIDKIYDGTIAKLINETILKGINIKVDENVERIDLELKEIENKKANKTEVANKEEIILLEKRMNEFTTLPENSTTGDAELIDGRISQSGLIFPNIGGNIRNLDSIINTTVLNYETLVNYDYDDITNAKDENGMIYVKHNIKKGDIFEIETECLVNHTVTFTKSIPVDKSLNNNEIINTTGNVKGKRIISDESYTSLMVWASDITKLRKLVIKKIKHNDDILKLSKLGVLDNLFNKSLLINEDIQGYTNNIVYKSVNLKKGNYYRVNIRTNIKNKYSLSATLTESKTQTETIIISDTINDTSDLIFYADKNYNYLRVYEEKSTNNNLHLIVEEIELTFNNKGKYERIIYIASSTSSDYDKANADIICTGTNDEFIFNKAVASLPYGGTIQLFDGVYNFDSFSTMNNSCVFFQNTGNGRTITIRGTTENKSFLSNYGVLINVTEKAFSSLVDGVEYSVFNSVNEKLPIYDHEAYPNNVNFENFYLFLYNSQKKVIGINGSNLGSMEVKQVGVYNKDYFYYRFNRLRPPSPVEGCIGILSVKGANDEMAKISLNCANAGGLWCGITIKGVEHLIMNTCTSSRNVYGYEFVGRCDKTLTVLNCADEGNRHLPIFKGTGSATIIDFCIERLHDDVIPFDPNGSIEPFAIEDTANGWKGFLSYRVQGNALGVNKFWKNGYGKGFRTVNLDNNISGSTRPTNPDYLCEFFDTTTNKLLIWNGLNWVDSMGNVVG